MKKLFTIVAFLACFLGARAEWTEVYSIDYSTKESFPFYVMGFTPEWVDGIMTDDGTEAGWHQYFIADGIPTELGGSYTVKAMVKASADVEFNVNMGWGWGDGEQIGTTVTVPASNDFQEVTWEYSNIGGASCNLVAQINAPVVIEWKSLVVGQDKKESRPIQYNEWLTSDGQPVVIESKPSAIATYMGDAEFGSWPAWALETEDDVNINWRGDRTGEICAWSLTMGRNFDEYMLGDNIGRARPFPCDITEDPDDPSNHVFVVDASKCDVIDSDENSWQWANQFWIQSPKGWKSGQAVTIKFRYKADSSTTVGTQIHKAWPSDYLFWNALGNVDFTTEWQEFNKTYTFNGDSDGGFSLAFNLNASDKDPRKFYFDDLSWETMVLDEGFFVASANKDKGIDYDFDNAIEFVDDGGTLVAQVGEVGKEDTWVNEVMISTLRGYDASFRGATIKVGADWEKWYGADQWDNYTAGSNAVIKLPAAGVYTISIDPEYEQINFLQLDGNNPPVLLPVVENPLAVTLDGMDKISQVWDNQFWIAATRDLTKGEECFLSFDYEMESDELEEAKVTTQSHKMGTNEKPCTYLGGGPISELIFKTNPTPEEGHYEGTFTVGSTGMRSIVFNMAEVETGVKYTIKNVVWMLNDKSEYLVDPEDAEGSFIYRKVGAGVPVQYPLVPKAENKFDIAGAPDGTADGFLDVSDLQMLINYITGLKELPEGFTGFNTDEDEIVDVSDLQLLINEIVKQ